MKNRTFYNYEIILNNFMQYLPSRVLVILSSFFILPIFTHILDVKEVSIYLISLQLLNLFCTCSFDWISKAVLRFYEKYRLQNKLDEFFSTIYIISVFIYLMVGFIYIFSKNILISKFAISNLIFILLPLLAIPCGIRQFFYQICRLKNVYMLYTISIILYQLIFITGSLLIVNYIHNASGIIVSMFCSIVLIDIFLFFRLREYHKIKPIFDNAIILEIFKYGTPLVVTNFLHWLILCTPNMIFQSSNMYLSASIMGSALAIINYTIQPFASLFSFINFPVVVKHSERNNQIETYHTSTVEMYLIMLLPAIFCFILYSGEIASILFPPEYIYIAIIIPFIAFKMFLHELLKLVNVKYHIQNKTYIEMSIVFITVFVFLFMNFKLYNHYTLLSSVLLIFISEVVLFFANLFITLKNENYINYKKVIKTTSKVLLIIFTAFLIVKIIKFPNYNFLKILKIILFMVINYSLLYSFRRKLLQ